MWVKLSPWRPGELRAANGGLFDYSLPGYAVGICYRRMGAALIIFLSEMGIATCSAKVFFCALRSNVARLCRGKEAEQI